MFRSTINSRWISTLYRMYRKTNIDNYQRWIFNRYSQARFMNLKPIGYTALLGFSWTFKKADSEPKVEEVKKININDSLKEIDQLFDNEQFNECCDHLKKLNIEYENNVEILWRLSRTLYKMAIGSNTDGKLKKKLANEAYDVINEALKVNDNHFAVHKWMAVILDLKASCDGIKERVKKLEVVKSHMMRAVEINPKDATTLYMLGEWCYQIADMPWYQRKIVETIFAQPPTSSYDEAISYFLKAEMVEPNFYSMNFLMLGKSYLKLQKNDSAKYYLTLAMLYPARGNDDHLANKEARDILKNME